MSMIRERFVDYLFELHSGKIPKVLEPQVEKVEGNVVYLKGAVGVKTAVMLGEVPYDSNLPCLGFALFGVYWPQVLGDVDKLVKKRWKQLQEAKET